MYKRYYDGYTPYSPVVAEADGEVIIPESDGDSVSCANDDNTKTEEYSNPEEFTSIASATSRNLSTRGGAQIPHSPKVFLLLGRPRGLFFTHFRIIFPHLFAPFCLNFKNVSVIYHFYD